MVNITHVNLLTLATSIPYANELYAIANASTEHVSFLSYNDTFVNDILGANVSQQLVLSENYQAFHEAGVFNRLDVDNLTAKAKSYDHVQLLLIEHMNESHSPQGRTHIFDGHDRLDGQDQLALNLTDSHKLESSGPTHFMTKIKFDY
ncbi:unnamed protein product [Aureobasidium mustum]|uniref:Uncharacterized protein n=1 Tax=Aureobasidium mustum TaxID=2773714 RepID=A0A9N8PKI6_9PEZI|nr:unnamed protein product [Aureobasidium mustum]